MGMAALVGFFFGGGVGALIGMAVTLTMWRHGLL